MSPCLERWLSQASLRAALGTHRAGTSRVVERKWLTFFSFFSLSRSRLAHKRKKSFWSRIISIQKNTIFRI
mgnify:CR=1 FL=1